MLVYLHGLNSSSRSHKASVLREHFGTDQVLAPDYTAHRPREAIVQLSAFFDQLDALHRPVVIASSMGGFYGQYLARHLALAHLYLINPALAPWTLFATRIGEWQTTAQGERYCIDHALIEATRRYAITNPCDGTPTTLLLDRGDAVIDYRIAERLYQPCSKAELRIWDGGDHAFQHMDAFIELLRNEHGV